MKLLESSCSELLNSALNFETGRCRIIGRVEIYSCKLVTTEKRLYKQLNRDLESDSNKLYSRSLTSDDGDGINSEQHLHHHHPHQNHHHHSQSHPTNHQSLINNNSTTPVSGNNIHNHHHQHLGGDQTTISRKTFFYLISTLNASFGPDYDFSKAKLDEFNREPTQHNLVINAIDANFLSSPAHQSYSVLKTQLWQAIDTAIQLQECEIFSYNPDSSSDPYSEEDCLWSFNYFFYNKKLKRVLFFTCRAISNHSSHTSDYLLDDSNDIYDMDDV